MQDVAFSTFGRKFRAESGILQLMDDLGKAVTQPGVIMMGGGNPSHIAEVQDAFRDRMARILDSQSDFENLIGNYDGPNGHLPFIDALVTLFREQYGWPIDRSNIALTNGSQTAFFMLFNLFGGRFDGGINKRILLPLAPEYIGYDDVGIADDLFVSYRPTIDILEDRLFKYHVDFDALAVDETIGAICVSRPTNPTGNVLTEREIEKLSRLAQHNNIPLIIDNAYGIPFPGIIFSEAQPLWQPHIVLCMSLSKLGLPGTRTGIVIANPQIIQKLVGMNAVLSLAPGGFGAALALDIVRSGQILTLSEKVIKPHYQQRAERAVSLLHTALDGCDYYIHKPEGAIFLWLWFRDLPIGSYELYQRLKQRGVVIVPGNYFFPGLRQPWQHKQECIRMNYAGDPEQVARGIEIIGAEIQRIYQEGKRQSQSERRPVPAG